ncbi:MAG: hypothetical protein V4631_10235 [Pseudomonadota bacterium]
MKTALLLAVLALPVHAADSPSAQMIKDVEGVYKNRFPAKIVVPGKADEKYEAEDVVEIVRHNDESIFVRASLTFANGHRCGFGIIATYTNGTFVYNDPNPDLTDKQSCMVTISTRGESLLLTDRAKAKGPSTCKALCGARESLGDYAIATSKKAKITYLPKLKASKEYVQALKAFNEMQR